MNRRDAVLAMFAGSMQLMIDSRAKLRLSQVPTTSVTVSLDYLTSIIVTKGSETRTITADEIWEALKG